MVPTARKGPTMKRACAAAAAAATSASCAGVTVGAPGCDRPCAMVAHEAVASVRVPAHPMPCGWLSTYSATPCQGRRHSV